MQLDYVLLLLLLFLILVVYSWFLLNETIVIHISSSFKFYIKILLIIRLPQIFRIYPCPHISFQGVFLSLKT